MGDLEDVVARAAEAGYFGSPGWPSGTKVDGCDSHVLDVIERALALVGREATTPELAEVVVRCVVYRSEAAIVASKGRLGPCLGRESLRRLGLWRSEWDA